MYLLILTKEKKWEMHEIHAMERAGIKVYGVPEKDRELHVHYTSDVKSVLQTVVDAIHHNRFNYSTNEHP